tara:strand:+ start:1169 stop:3457 length:2289 start_codon:yes stop_codon:yes gene_type:complete
MKILRRLLLIFILSLFIFLLGLHNDISKKSEVEYAGAAISNSELEFQDEIELGCIFLDNFENIDLNELKISLTIPDSRRWYTNIINGELNDGDRIAEEYKEQQYGYFNILNLKNKNECKIEANVRISGDAADHIDLENLTASIDVDLLYDNLFGYTNFKLFLPESRYFENEIFVTSLLTDMGYLAPTSFFIDIDVNGHNTKYIFQEKINKIFIESNDLKEGPIIEGNEQIAWGDRGWFTFDTLLPPKIINKTWLKKSNFNTEFAKFALEKVHKIKIFGIDEGDIDTYFCVDCILNYESLSEANSNYLKEYQLMLTVLRAHHGLSFSDRKYYIDPNTEFLYSIYYDGTPTLLVEKDGKLILNKSELGDEKWEQQIPVLNLKLKNINNLINKINKIDYKQFEENLIKKGIDIDKLDFTEGEFKKYLTEDLKGYTQELDIRNNQTFDLYLSKNIEKNEEYFILIENELGYSLCEVDLINCVEFYPSNEDLVEILSGDYYFENRIVFFMGNIKNLQQNFLIKYLDFNEFKNKDLSYSVHFYGNADISYNKDTLSVSNPNSEFRLLVSSANLVNQKIIFQSDNNNVQYSKTLLTGCVNIINSKLENFKFESTNASCEDALNIVNSTGTVASINIKNSKHDGLDLDFSDILIRKLNIIEAGNDCSDFSYGNYKLIDLSLKNCFDKAISIGEKSIFNGENVKAENSNIGLAAKDSATVNINYLNSMNNEYCIASYRKKQEFRSPNINIEESNCSEGDIYNQIQNLESKK